MKRIAVIITVLLVVSVGCNKNAITRSDMQDNMAGKNEQKSDVSEQKKQEKIPALPVESIGSKNDTTADTAIRDNMFNDILFEYDSYAVKETSRQIMRNVADWMSKHPEARISIEGHCDERGTNEYNLALGDRRAKAVREYLQALGVASKKADTISYGEERPLCKENTEVCWTKNRRAHFAVLGTSVGQHRK